MSLREMVEQLPDPDRQALILTAYRGMTQKQLAETLGISLSGAKSRVQRDRLPILARLIAKVYELVADGSLIRSEPAVARTFGETMMAFSALHSGLHADDSGSQASWLSGVR